VLRAYLAELEERGLLSPIRTAVSAATRSLIDAGNSAPRWIDGPVMDEFLAAVASTAGRETVRDLGRRAMRESAGAILQPVIGFVLSFYSLDPAALLARADGMADIVSQGTRLSWKRSTGDAGVMTMSCEEPVPDAWWAAWEGALSHAFAITRTNGDISPARAENEGRSAVIEISWRPGKEKAR